MTDGFRAFDPAEMDATQAYHLLNSLVVPRPIAWVSTLSERGVANIAPHSYFTVLAPSRHGSQLEHWAEVMDDSVTYHCADAPESNRLRREQILGH